MQNLGKKSIAVVVDKKNRGLLMQNILEKAGYQCSVSYSLYDALQTISQEMPHLIITETILSDGNAGTLFDRISQHQTLKTTPIMCSVLRKSKEEIQFIGKRQFAGIFLGQVDSQVILKKIDDIFKINNYLSPYFINFFETNIFAQTHISIRAKIVGVIKDFLVAVSKTELDHQVKFICKSDEIKFKEAEVSEASNLFYEKEVFNLFPLNQITGEGRLWMNQLPKFFEILPELLNKTPVVLCVTEDQNYFKQLQSILEGYGISLFHCKDVQTAIMALKKNPKIANCVFIYEPQKLPVLTKELDGIYNSIPAENRVPLVYAVTKLKRSSLFYRYIKAPFGLSYLIQTLKSAAQRPQAIAQAAEKSGYLGVQTSFLTKGNIIGLDENGGILELYFPMIQGGEVYIDHPILQKLWVGSRPIIIEEIVPHPTKLLTWHARFDNPMKGNSKAKYYFQLKREVEKFKETNPIEILDLNKAETTVSYDEG